MNEYTSFRVKRFTDGDFTITCIANFGATLEAWLSHKDYGVANLMFAIPIQDKTLKEFIPMVEANLKANEELYILNVMKGAEE